MYVICHGQGGYDEQDIYCFPIWDFDPCCSPDPAGDFRDGAIRYCIALGQYHIDPKTATRPLEDDQPLGAVPSHRVIFNAADEAYPH